MGIQIQAADVTISSAWREVAVRPWYAFVEPPANTPSERCFEVLDCFTCDCIHHLLVKARIGFRRTQPGTNQQVWIFEIDGFVKPLVLAVIVDHRHTLANGTGKEMFVLNFQRHFVSEKFPEARIESVALKRAGFGSGNVDIVREYASVDDFVVWHYVILANGRMFQQGSLVMR